MLERLARLAPGRWTVWARLGRVYERMNRTADAERARAEVRRLQPVPTPPERTLRPLGPIRRAPKGR